MSTDIRITELNPSLKKAFFDFAKLVHPNEQGIIQRMEWFTFGNPNQSSQKSLPGLATVITDGEIIGQFLMSPFEFQIRQKKFTGHFGYDFFVKEEYRSRGAGALLFVQGVRMYKPFIGVGLTNVVEKISKAAGIQTIGSLKKFIWVRNPMAFGGQLLKRSLIKDSGDEKKAFVNEVLPDAVEDSGLKFQRCSSLPEGFGPSCSDEALEPVRSQTFMRWRFFDSPRRYHMYIDRDHAVPMFFVVRNAFYQGMRLLLIVDHRFPAGKVEYLDMILRVAKKIAADAHLDGVVMASTHALVEGALIRERFMAAGKPSAVIAYLPSEDFSPPITSINLTMADSDMDFSFGEDR